MIESARCPECDSEIPTGSPAGLCPKCLLQAGLDSQQPVAPQFPPTQPSPLPSPAQGFVPPSPEHLAVRFPQLEIQTLLGRGGMGAVYKAKQRGLDRLVALKILPPEVSHDPAFAERFTREARALAKLTHSNIVTVYDFGQADGLFYFLMEYVDGVNLRQAIQAGNMTPQEALAIVPQICEALQFAHDEGIVHRDIKPENILIDKRGRVKIADFGLAKLLGTDASNHSLTATHQVMGTLRYMAPEQMQGSREVDHRADIYSLGVVFYELLTGELPMGKFAPPSKRVQVDVRLDEIVLRALEQEPEQRYQHASEVKTDVEAISRSPQEGSQARPQPPIAVSIRWPRLPAWYGWAFGAGFVVAVLVTVAIFVRITRNSPSQPGAGSAPPTSVPFIGFALMILAAMVALVVCFFVGRAVWRAGGKAGGVKTGAGPVSLPAGRRPNFGLLAMGGIMLVLGLVLLACSTIPGAGVLQWVGLGIALGGGGCFSSAWQEDQRLPPGFAPNPGELAMGGVMLVVGIVLLLIVASYNQFAPPSPLAWTAIGITLGSGWCFVAAWQDEDEDEDDNDETEESEQPYQHAREMKPGAATATDLVQAPADCLLLAAGVAFVTACGVALWLLTSPTSSLLTSLVRGNLTIASVTLVTYSLLIGVAGLLLRQLRARFFVLLLVVIAGLFLPAVIAVNVAMEFSRMPEWPVAIPLWLGIPVALWVVARLFRDDVRRAFDVAAEQRAENTGTDPVSLPPTAPPIKRPKLVPVLAAFNLVGALVLMLVCAMEEPAAFARSVPRLWQVWEQVDAVLGFVMAAGMFAASIGLFLWKPWARKVTLGVCIFGLASFVFDAPYLARFAIPDFYAEIQQSVVAEGVEPDLQDFVTLSTFVVLFGGLFVVGLTCLIGQLVYFTRPQVVAAFEAQGENYGRFIEWLFTGAGVVVGLLSVFAPLALLLGLAALFNAGGGEEVAPAAGRGDDARIQGSWNYVASMRDGQITDSEDFQRWKVNFTQGEYTEQPAERFEKGTYRLDPTKTPKTIDCFLSEGPYKGLAVAGIYELDGDTLKICWSRWGSLEHPKEFDSAPGSQRALVVLKRDSPVPQPRWESP